MHLPWQLHTASGGLVQRLSESEVTSWYLVVIHTPPILASAQPPCDVCDVWR